MDYRFTPEQEAFRQEFMSWVAKNLPPDYNPELLHNYETTEDWINAFKMFQKRMFDGGYAAMHYPKAYGGQGKTLMEEVIVLQVTAKMCPEIRQPGGVMLGMAVPTIYTCCSEAQKHEYLPKIFDGTHIWCQAFSEPNAGSDLANCSTRAVRKDGYYVLDGQKTWTSFAHMADYCIILVRTDTTVSKFKGLSYLLLDMKLPGIEIRPMPQMTGDAEFNEIFFDNVKVPMEMRVGEEGQGWNIAITTLMFERVIGDARMAARFESNVLKMIRMAKEVRRSGHPLIDHPVFRQQLAQAYIEIMTLKYHGLRNLSKQLAGGIPGPEGSISKILWSEPNQRLSDAAVTMLGPRSQIMRGTDWSVQDGFWQYQFLRSKGNTIEAGTSEIQRNIIGERCLGLPKDVSRSMRQK